MKKGLVLILSLITIFCCACSLSKPQPDSDSDNSRTHTTPTQIKFDYPDQLKFKNGGTTDLTIYKCDAVYYACTGGQSWAELYGTLPVDIEDGEFIYGEADFDLVYGGINGYWGNMYIKKLRNERRLSFDEVVDCRMVEIYNIEDSNFAGLRLLVKDGNNYLICRDPMRQYRLYDNCANLLCTYETSMACASFLEDGPDQMITYGSPSNLPYAVFRIGDVYYAYSRYDGCNKWTTLLNMYFENKPLGFELKDGQGMKINTTTVYLVNGGKEKYTNAPMFGRMENYFSVNYSEFEGEVSAKQWDRDPRDEDGSVYSYWSDPDLYLIFYIDDTYYIYCETNSEKDTERFIGEYKTAEEVNASLGRE